MTVEAFIAKWSEVELTERSAAQAHFLDLCELVGHPKPQEADPKGEWFTFERGASKQSGGDGWPIAGALQAQGVLVALPVVVTGVDAAQQRPGLPDAVLLPDLEGYRLETLVQRADAAGYAVYRQLSRRGPYRGVRVEMLAVKPVGWPAKV